MTPLRQKFEQYKADLQREATLAGLSQGKAEGKAEGILALLAARQIAVGEAVAAKILRCKDLVTLDRWLVRSATAPSAPDVIAEN
jgi:hypothetical protein